MKNLHSPPAPAGKRFDAGKLRLDLLPPDALAEVAKVLGAGAVKYGDRNWELGMDYSRVLGPLLRHINEFQLGIRHDRETGCHVLAHAVCNGLFLLAYELRTMNDWDNLPFGAKSIGRKRE